MSVIRRKKLALTFLTLVLLGAATLAAFYLLQQNQDTRRQAQVCDPSNPHCKTPSSSGDSGQGTTNPDLSKKGIVATTFSGTRPSTQAACSAGVWMNNFCYMPGDEFAGGKVVVASGRYNYPYIEDKKTYENINFEAAVINRNLGSTTSLGEDCGGQGMAISGICYAYGATVNGYVVMPQRISGCDNATGNYCYPHLKKIETSYSDWQKAVGAYQETGALTELENLYKKLYGTNFVADNLFDSKAPNADLLRAQALITALTNAAIIKEQAASQNAALQAKGNLTAAEQATFNYNASILADANLHLRYQAIDQLGASAANSLTTEAALNRMYNSLVVADASELNRIATDKFKEIFGYDPMTKYNNLDGILNAIGLDVASLNQDRAVYAANVAAATAKQEQDVKRVNDEYQKFLNGESTSIAGLRQAAVAAGVVTTSQLNGLSDAETLAIILAGFSGQPLSKARQEAQAVLDLKVRIAKEKELMTSYAESLKNNDGGDPGSLYALYEFYTGTKLTGRVSDAWLKSEISKHNQQFALLAFQQDLNPTYLENSYQANREIGLSPDERMPTNERVLLKELYGEEIGEEVYLQSVLPVKLQAAAVNFAVDGGAAFRQVCNEVGLSNCNVDSTNATNIIAEILQRTTSPDANINVHELALNYSTAIFADSREAQRDANLSALGSMIAYNSAASNFSTRDLAGDFYNDQVASMQAASVANQAARIFDTYQTYAYAREYQDQISATTFGLAYGNALMNDNLLNRRFDLGAPTYPLYNQAAANSATSDQSTPANNLGLTRNQALGLSFYQVGTQVFGMTTPAQDIASNYATAARDNYSGPAGTYLSNLAMTGARNIGLVDEYQTVSLEYYNDPVSSIKAAGTYVGAVFAANKANAQAIGFTPDGFRAGVVEATIDPYEYAKAEAAKTKTALLYDRYVAESNTDLEALTAFRSDAEIQRSAAALKYETIEKVVVPVTATVLLPSALLSGVSSAAIFGLASSQFSLYQGAGMKAQALELQRYDIETRRYAAVEMARAEGASEQEIAQLEQDIADQVKVLNNQGNLMLVSSAVAGFMGFGGWASGAANASQLAGISNNLVSATAKTGLVLTRMGQVSGIGLNTYNFGTSSLGAYQAFAAGDNAEGWNNTLVAATALTGVFGNANNLRGLQTSGTHKLDFWADLTGAATGTSTDVMQIQAACGNDSGAFDQRQCMNAWIGLALSAGMDVNQISSSHRLVRGDQQTARLGELNAQLDVVGVALTRLKLEGQTDASTTRMIADLTTRYTELSRQITDIDPNFKVPSTPPDKNYQAAVGKIIADINIDRQRVLADGDTEQARILDSQVALLRAKAGEIEGLRLVIDNLDAQVNSRGLVMSDAELTRLQTERTAAVDKLKAVAAELTVIPSLKAQHDNIITGAEANYALANQQRLAQVDVDKNMAIAAKIDQEALAAYKNELAAMGELKLESNNALRLLSLEAVAADEVALARLAAQPAATRRSLGEVVSDFFAWRDRPAREAYRQALDLTVREADLRSQLDGLPPSSDQAGSIARELTQVRRQLVDQKHIIAQAVPAVRVGEAGGNVAGAPANLPNRNLTTTLAGWGSGLRTWLTELTTPPTSPTALRQLKQSLPVTITSEQQRAVLDSESMRELTTRLLLVPAGADDSANRIALIRQEAVALNQQKLLAEQNLAPEQARLVAELVELHREIFAVDEPASLTVLRSTYQQRLTELKNSLLGADPGAAELAAYQKLAAVQQFFKTASLIDSIKTADPFAALAQLGRATEVRVELSDPLLTVRLQALAQELELRAGITDGIEFFSSRENQVDTALKILGGERVAVELTTSGGKTFVGGVVLRAQTDLFGHETGIYIAKPGDAPEVRRKLVQFLGLGEEAVVLLDHTRLGDANYVKMIGEAKYVIAETTSLEFVRNIANNFSHNDSLPANQVYRKLTQNVAVYMDELQINLDPTRQAIVSVGQSSDSIPKHYEDAAAAVGLAFENTLLRGGGWGLGEHDFLKITSERGADIAKLQTDAQQVVFAELARNMSLSEADYNMIKERRLEVNVLLSDQARLTEFLQNQLGGRVTTSQAEMILNQIDMANAFAAGLKMKYGTHYRRMVDEVLQANNGLNRPLTVPAADGAPSFGQSYNARMQAAMEYIGARAAGQTPDFTGLTASPNLAYRANIADYVGDLRQSAFGAVTGAMADGYGVVETGLGLVSYRSTDAVQKILGLEDSRTGGRINVDRSYQVQRQDYLQAIVRLQAEGQLNQSAGESTRGNLKIVLGFDGVVEAEVAARYLGGQAEFAGKTFFVKQPDGSYAHLRVENDQLTVIDGRSRLSTGEVQDMFRTGMENAVIIMGRAGATGDSIATNKSVLGITVTSFDAPEGLVAQAGARIDRSGEIADQIALVVKKGVAELDQVGLGGSKMSADDFADWRTNVVKVQTEYERAKLTQALNQGVSSASTRVLSDLIRDSENPELRKWASERLLEFYTQSVGRDLDLDGGDQVTLLARQQQLAAEAMRWQQLLADANNRQMLNLVRQEHSALYRRMTANAGIDPEKLAYATRQSSPTSREEVITAGDLQQFINQHGRFVTAGAESAFVASSSKPPAAEQVALRQPAGPTIPGGSDVGPVRSSITGDVAENAAASADLVRANTVAAATTPNRLSTFWHGTFGDKERARLLEEQAEQVIVEQSKLQAQLEEERTWLRAELANASPALTEESLRNLNASLQEIDRQLEEANLHTAAELAVIEQHQADYTTGGLRQWASSQLRQLTPTRALAGLSQMMNAVWDYTADGEMSDLEDYMAAMVDDEEQAAARMGGVFERVATWWQNQSRQEGDTEEQTDAFTPVTFAPVDTSRPATWWQAGNEWLRNRFGTSQQQADKFAIDHAEQIAAERAALQQELVADDRARLETEEQLLRSLQDNRAIVFSSGMSTEQKQGILDSYDQQIAAQEAKIEELRIIIAAKVQDEAEELNKQAVAKVREKVAAEGVVAESVVGLAGEVKQSTTEEEGRKKDERLRKIYSIGKHLSNNLIVSLSVNFVGDRHAIVFTDEDENWYLRDLGSGFDTYLNGKRINPETDYLIKENDDLFFGDLGFEGSKLVVLRTPNGDLTLSKDSTFESKFSRISKQSIFSLVRFNLRKFWLGSFFDKEVGANKDNFFSKTLTKSNLFFGNLAKKVNLPLYDKNSPVGKLVILVKNTWFKLVYSYRLNKFNEFVEILENNGVEVKDKLDLYSNIISRGNFDREIGELISINESEKIDSSEELLKVLSGIELTQSEVPEEIFGGSAGFKYLSGLDNSVKSQKSIDFYEFIRVEAFNLFFSESDLVLSESNVDSYLDRISKLNSWASYIRKHYRTTLDDVGSDEELEEIIGLVFSALARDIEFIRQQKFDQTLFASLFIDKPFFDGLILANDEDLPHAYDNFGQSTRSGDIGAWESWFGAINYQLDSLDIPELKDLHKQIFSWYDNDSTNPTKKSDRAGILRDPNDPKDREPLYAKDYQDGRPLILTQDQINNLEKLKSLIPGRNEPIMKFRFADGVSGPDDNGNYYGYVEFCKAEDVEAELLATINWYNKESSRPHDPYLLAAELQQRFIAIHPFRDGNGRTSRWLMNWSLRRDGVDSAILYDTDQDMYSSVEDWANELRLGELRFKSLKKQLIIMTMKGIPSDFIIPQIEISGTENWDYFQWTQFLAFYKNNDKLLASRLKAEDKLSRHEFYQAIKEAVVKFKIYQLTNTRYDLGGLVDPYYANSFSNTHPAVQKFIRKNYSQGLIMRRGAFNKLFLDSRFTNPEDVLTFFYNGQDDLIASNGSHRNIVKEIYSLIKDVPANQHEQIIGEYLNDLIKSIKSKSTQEIDEKFPNLVVNNDLLNEIDSVVQFLSQNKGVKLPDYFARKATDLYNYILIDIFNNPDPVRSNRIIEGHVDGSGLWNDSPFTSYSKNEKTPEIFSTGNLYGGNVNSAFVFTSFLPRLGVIYDQNYDGVYNFKKKQIYNGLKREEELLVAGGQNLSLLNKVEMWMKTPGGSQYKASIAERISEDQSKIRLTVYNSRNELLRTSIFEFDLDGKLVKIDEQIHKTDDSVEQKDLSGQQVLAEDKKLTEELSKMRSLATSLGASQIQQSLWEEDSVESLEKVSFWISELRNNLLEVASFFGIPGYEEADKITKMTQITSVLLPVYEYLKGAGAEFSADAFTNAFNESGLEGILLLLDKPDLINDLKLSNFVDKLIDLGYPGNTLFIIKIIDRNGDIREFKTSLVDLDEKVLEVVEQVEAETEVELLFGSERDLFAFIMIGSKDSPITMDEMLPDPDEVVYSIKDMFFEIVSPPSLSRQGLGIIHPVVGQGLLQSQAANPAATTHQTEIKQYRIMNFVYNQHLPDELQDLIPVEVQRELAVRLNNAYLQANPWVVLAQKNVDVHTVFLDLQPNREISLHLLTDFIRYQARAIIEQTLKEHGIDLPGEVQLHQFLRVGVSLDPEKALTFSLLQRNFAQQLPPGLETLFGALSGLMEVPEKLLSGDHLPIIEQVSDKESAELIQPIVGKNVELLGRMLSWGDHSAISGDLMTEVVASQSLPNFTDAQVAEWSQYSFDSYFTIAKVLELLTPEQQAQFGQQVLEIDFGEDTHLSPVTLDLGESLTGVVDITPYSDIANQMTGSAASPTEAQALLDGFRTINLHWQAQATALFADSPEIGINEYSGDGFKLILLGRPSAATLAKLLSLNESYAQALQAARAGQLGPAAQAAAEFIAERFSDKLFVKVALNAGPAALRFYAQNQFGYIATELLTEADLDGLMKQSKDYKKANGINTAVMAISASVATEYAADELAAEGLEIVEMEGRLFVRRLEEGVTSSTSDWWQNLRVSLVNTWSRWNTTMRRTLPILGSIALGALMGASIYFNTFAPTTPPVTTTTPTAIVRVEEAPAERGTEVEEVEVAGMNLFVNLPAAGNNSSIDLQQSPAVVAEQVELSAAATLLAQAQANNGVMSLTMAEARALGDLSLMREVYLRDVILEYERLQATAEGQEIIQAAMPLRANGQQRQAFFIDPNSLSASTESNVTFRLFVEQRLSQAPDLFPAELLQSSEFNAGMNAVTAYFGIGIADGGNVYRQIVQCVGWSALTNALNDEIYLTYLPLEAAGEVGALFNQSSPVNGLSFSEARARGVKLSGEYSYNIGRPGIWTAWSVDSATELQAGDLLFYGIHVARVSQVMEVNGQVMVFLSQANDPSDLYVDDNSSTTMGLPELEAFTSKAFESYLLEMGVGIDDVLVVRAQLNDYAQPIAAEVNPQNSLIFGLLPSGLLANLPTWLTNVAPALLPNFSILYQNAQLWFKSLPLLPQFLPEWMQEGLQRASVALVIRKQVNQQVLNLCLEIDSCRSELAFRQQALLINQSLVARTYLDLLQLSLSQPHLFSLEQLIQIRNITELSTQLNWNWQLQAAPWTTRLQAALIKLPINLLNRIQHMIHGANTEAVILEQHLDEVLSFALPRVKDSDNLLELKAVMRLGKAATLENKLNAAIEVIKHGQTEAATQAQLFDQQLFASLLNSATSPWRRYAKLNLDLIRFGKDSAKINATSFDETRLLTMPQVELPRLAETITNAYNYVLNEETYTWRIGDDSLLGEKLLAAGVKQVSTRFNRNSTADNLLAPKEGYVLVGNLATNYKPQSVAFYHPAYNQAELLAMYQHVYSRTDLNQASRELLADHLRPSLTEEEFLTLVEDLAMLPVLVLDLKTNDPGLTNSTDFVNYSVKEVDDLRFRFVMANFITMVKSNQRDLVYSINTNHNTWDGTQVMTMMNKLVELVNYDLVSLSPNRLLLDVLLDNEANSELRAALTPNVDANNFNEVLAATMRTPSIEEGVYPDQFFLEKMPDYQQVQLNVDATDFFLKIDQVASFARQLKTSQPNYLPADSSLSSPALVMQLAMVHFYRQALGVTPDESTGLLLLDPNLDGDLDLARLSSGFDLSAWLEADESTRIMTLQILDRELRQAKQMSNIHNIISPVVNSLPTSFHRFINGFAKLLPKTLTYLESEGMISGFAMPRIGADGKVDRSEINRQQSIGYRMAGPALAPSQTSAITISSFQTTLDKFDHLQKLILSIRIKNRDNIAAHRLATELRDWISGGWRQVSLATPVTPQNSFMLGLLPLIGGEGSGLPTELLGQFAQQSLSFLGASFQALLPQWPILQQNMQMWVESRYLLPGFLSDLWVFVQEKTSTIMQGAALGGGVINTSGLPVPPTLDSGGKHILFYLQFLESENTVILEPVNPSSLQNFLNPVDTDDFFEDLDRLRELEKILDGWLKEISEKYPDKKIVIKVGSLHSEFILAFARRGFHKDQELVIYDKPVNDETNQNPFKNDFFLPEETLLNPSLHGRVKIGEAGKDDYGFPNYRENEDAFGVGEVVRTFGGVYEDFETDSMQTELVRSRLQELGAVGHSVTSHGDLTINLDLLSNLIDTIVFGLRPQRLNSGYVSILNSVGDFYAVPPLQSAGLYFKGFAVLVDPRLEKPFINLEDYGTEYLPTNHSIIIVPSAKEKTTIIRGLNDLSYGSDSLIDREKLLSLDLENRIFTYDDVLNGALDQIYAIPIEIPVITDSSVINIPPSIFSSLCSNCADSISKTYAFTKEFDQLFADYQRLQAELAELNSASPIDHLAVSAAAVKLAEIKAQAFESLNEARNKVLNEHGYHNQLILTYLDALLYAKEASLRQTEVDTKRAIQAVYEATVLLEAALKYKSISLRTNTTLGFGGTVVEQSLEEEDLDLIRNLLRGNEDQGLEGLYSLAYFSEAAVLNPQSGSIPSPLTGQLFELQKSNNLTAGTSQDRLRIWARSQAAAWRQQLLLPKLHVRSVTLANPLLGQFGGAEPKVEVDEEIKPITPSPNPDSPVPSAPPTNPDPGEQAPRFNWAAVLHILAMAMGATLFGSVVANQLPIFAVEEIDLVEPLPYVQRSEDLAPREIVVDSEPAEVVYPPAEVAPLPPSIPTPPSKPAADPAEVVFKSITLNTAMPEEYATNGIHYSLYDPDKKKFVFYGDRWKPIDLSILPGYTDNRNPDDYYKTIKLFQVSKSPRYIGEYTYCNIYVWDVTAALGVPLPHWIDGKEQRAKHIYDLLGSEYGQKELGWREVSAREAQEYANRGIPTLGTTPAYMLNGYEVSGHIAMIVPGEGVEVGGEYYPASAQAGRINFDDGTPTNIGFEGALANGLEIKYYINEGSYEFVSP